MLLRLFSEIFLVAARGHFPYSRRPPRPLRYHGALISSTTFILRRGDWRASVIFPRRGLSPLFGYSRIIIPGDLVQMTTCIKFNNFAKENIYLKEPTRGESYDLFASFFKLFSRKLRLNFMFFSSIILIFFATSNYNVSNCQTMFTFLSLSLSYHLQMQGAILYKVSSLVFPCL